MTYNITMVPSTEGFIGIADIPNQSQVQKPQMDLWNSSPLNTDNANISEKSKETKMPILVHIYVGTLTVLGLYFLYRCTKTNSR